MQRATKRLPSWLKVKSVACAIAWYERWSSRISANSVVCAAADSGSRYCSRTSGTPPRARRFRRKWAHAVVRVAAKGHERVLDGSDVRGFHLASVARHRGPRLEAVRV